VENLIMARRSGHPRDERESAVALVEQVRSGEYKSQWAAIESVAVKVGVSGETLRKWVWGSNTRPTTLTC
jgi:transposase